MRKGLLITLTAILFLLMAAGCGSNTSKPESSNSNNTGGEATPTQQENKPEPSKEPVTIKLNGWHNNKAEQEIREIIANFEKENSDIKVEYVPLVTNGSSTEYLQKLDVMMAADEKVDVVSFPSIDFLIERAARGVLAPLDDFHKAYNVNPKEEYYIDPVYEGKSYGIQDLASLWFVALNEDALKEANLPIPTWEWTWDDFREYSKKLTKGSGETKQFGSFFHTWGEYANLIAYTELKHPYMNESKQPNFLDPSFAQFFNLRRAMETEDKSVAALSDIIGAKLHYRTEFINKKAAMVPTASFFIGQLLDRESNPHDFKTVFAPMPRSSSASEIGLSYLGGNFEAIGANSEHKEEAYRFIRYLSTQQEVIRDMPGWRKADSQIVLEKLIGEANTDLIDLESLSATMFDKRIKSVYDANLSTATSGQMKKVLEDGFTEFMLNNLSAEEAQQRMQDAASKLK